MNESLKQAAIEQMFAWLAETNREVAHICPDLAQEITERNHDAVHLMFGEADARVHRMRCILQIIDDFS